MTKKNKVKRSYKGFQDYTKIPDKKKDVPKEQKRLK